MINNHPYSVKQTSAPYVPASLFDDLVNTHQHRQHTKTVSKFLTEWGLVEEQLQWPNMHAYKAAEIILHSEHTNRLDRIRAENFKRIWKTHKGVVPADLAKTILRKAEYCEHKRKNSERELIRKARKTEEKNMTPNNTDISRQKLLTRQQHILDKAMARGLKVNKKKLTPEALAEATQKQKIYQQHKLDNAMARERRLARKAEKKLHRETMYPQNTNK